MTESGELLRNAIVDLEEKLKAETFKSESQGMQIQTANSIRQEFAKILKGIPSSVVSEIFKKEGIVAKLLASGNTTQVK